MDKSQITLRVTAGEKQMLQRRAAKYGLTVNSLIRFWVNSEPSSPRAFRKVRCDACKGTGKTDGVYTCKKCQGAGFMYAEI